MHVTEDQRAGIGVALNEATWLGLEVSVERRAAAATFAVLSLPPEGLPPEDRRVQFIFHPVGRVAASLRRGRWNDWAAEVIPFDLADLLTVVQSFKGLPIYGWEFLNVPPASFTMFPDRVSLDYRAGTDGLSHSLLLFQEGGNDRYLEVAVWFDELTIRGPLGNDIALEDFIAGGVRWWDALYASDPRTQGAGMFPLG